MPAWPPGFTAKDANGETWFVSFDAKANPRGATAAVVIATKIFWALGYNQVEYFITEFSRDDTAVDPGATRKRPSGKRTPMTTDDVREILGNVPRDADGTLRAAAGRMLPGKILGGFKYEGTRPDDPNDFVPHQHRRELRALRVFGAWTNLTDMKAGNTLDRRRAENGRSVVRHYLQDVGSTFGVGANGPHDWNEGWEYMYDGGATRKRLLHVRLRAQPLADGRLSGPPGGRTLRGRRLRPRDLEATGADARLCRDAGRRRLLGGAAGDGIQRRSVRAVVKTGQINDEVQEKHLADALILRRDKIGRAICPKSTRSSTRC